MKILLLSATQFEIQPFLQSSPKIDVLIGGVGVPATVYHLTKQLNHHHYDLVIQAGIAGAFSEVELVPCEVVTVQKDCFADLGAIEKKSFQTVQDMGFSNEPEWILNTNPLLNKLNFKQVKAVTVNTVTDNNDAILTMQKKWNAEIESMEGAALHYVCHHQKVNYLQLRCISNVVGVRDKTKWNIKKAIDNLNQALVGLMDSV